MYSKIKNIRDLCKSINDFKNVYQPWTTTARNEKCDLFTDSHNTLASWRNLSPQLFNEHVVSEFWQTMHTAEPLVPEPSALEIEMAIENFKRRNSPVLIKSQ
jgi:hypothetical protein